MGAAGWAIVARVQNNGKTSTITPPSNQDKAEETYQRQRTKITVFNTQAELDEELQAQDFTARTVAPEHPVDWNQQSLLKVAYQAPSTGYALDAVYNEPLLKLTIREPGPNCAQKQLITPLVQYVVLPKTTQPPELQFVVNTQEACFR